MKLSNVNLAVSAFAALAGVVFAAMQTFGPSGPPPVKVTVTLDPAQSSSMPDMSVEKSTGSEAVNSGDKGDGGLLVSVSAGPETVALDLSRSARFLAAFKDGSGERYVFGDLFDGRPDTAITITRPDSEINLLVDFGTQTALPLTAIEYTPPPAIQDAVGATVLDVMVLPEGQLSGAGETVMSYTLQTEPGRQTFSLPAGSRGKGLWLHVGGPAAEKIAVGDFRVLTR